MPQKTQHSFISSNPKKGQHISGQDNSASPKQKIFVRLEIIQEKSVILHFVTK